MSIESKLKLIFGYFLMFRKNIDDMPEDSQVLFMNKLNNLLGFINATYGKIHKKSDKQRINEEFVINGSSYLFEDL